MISAIDDDSEPRHQVFRWLKRARKLGNRPNGFNNQ